MKYVGSLYAMMLYRSVHTLIDDITIAMKYKSTIYNAERPTGAAGLVKDQPRLPPHAFVCV